MITIRLEAEIMASGRSSTFRAVVVSSRGDLATLRWRTRHDPATETHEETSGPSQADLEKVPLELADSLRLLHQEFLDLADEVRARSKEKKKEPTDERPTSTLG